MCTQNRLDEMDLLDKNIPEHVRLYAARSKEILELKEAYKAKLKAKEETLKELEPMVLKYLKDHGNRIDCPAGTQYGPAGNIQIRSYDRKRKLSQAEQVSLMADFYKQHLNAETQELEDFAKACLDYVDQNRGRVHQESIYRHVKRPRKKRKREETDEIASVPVDLLNVLNQS